MATIGACPGISVNITVIFQLALLAYKKSGCAHPIIDVEFHIVSDISSISIYCQHAQKSSKMDTFAVATGCIWVKNAGIQIWAIKLRHNGIANTGSRCFVQVVIKVVINIPQALNFASLVVVVSVVNRD